MGCDLILVPKLIGGLGNQLFILAATVEAASRLGAKLVFRERSGNPHCDRDMTLLQLFPGIEFRQGIAIDSEVSGSESCFDYNDILPRLPLSGTIYISGYNQHTRYVPEGFCQFMKQIPEPHMDVSGMAFLHCRRTDYVGWEVMAIDYAKYYRAALVDLLSKRPDVRILIVSDDIAWANANIPPLLTDLLDESRFVKLSSAGTATSTLKLMAGCSAGAICANSTLSWWGAYANRDRPIYMPAPWSDYDHSRDLGLYFEGVIKLECR